MSINLGTEAVDAARRLRGSAEWLAFVDAMRTQAGVLMNRAMDNPDRSQLAHDLGYAKAFRDMYAALRAATEGLRHIMPAELPNPADTADADSSLAALSLLVGGTAPQVGGKRANA